MRSTTCGRLTMCRKARTNARPTADELLIAAAITLAESSDLTQLLDEVRAIRERLDALSVGNALAVTSLAF